MARPRTRALGCRGSSAWWRRSWLLFLWTCQFHAPRWWWTCGYLQWQHAKGVTIMDNYRCDSDCKGVHIHTYSTSRKSSKLNMCHLSGLQLECFTNLLSEKRITLRSLMWKWELCMDKFPDIRFQKQSKGWHTFVVFVTFSFLFSNVQCPNFWLALHRNMTSLPLTSDTWICSSSQKAPFPFLALYILSSKQLYTTPNSNWGQTSFLHTLSMDFYWLWDSLVWFDIPPCWQQRR